MASPNTLKIQASGGKSRMIVHTSPCKYPFGTRKPSRKVRRLTTSIQ